MRLKDRNNFDVDLLDGKHASNSANNVPILDGNAKLPFAQLPTGTGSSNVAIGNHNHGLLHDTLGISMTSTTTDSGWSMINGSYNGFILKSIRTNADTPDWIRNNYGAGIAFGGGDTKGVLSVAYNSPAIKIAGGNGTKPVWWIGVTGTSAKTYNMDSLAASTANTLATARTINGTSFNGSANITTANWGTARTLTIGSTGKSVNGSGNVSWSLSEIGAAASSHTHSYLPLSGGTLTGRLIANGKISLPTTGSSWITGKTLTNASIAIATKQTTDSYHPILAVQSSSNHVVNIGGLGDDVGFYGYKADRTANGTDWRFTFNASSGAVTCSSVVNAGGGFQWNGQSLDSRYAASSHNHTSLSSVTAINGAGSGGSWGSLDIGGSKSSWAGIRFTGAGNNYFLMHSDGQSGVWRGSNGAGIWSFDANGNMNNGAVPWSRVSGKPDMNNYATTMHNWKNGDLNYAIGQHYGLRSITVDNDTTSLGSIYPWGVAVNVGGSYSSMQIYSPHQGNELYWRSKWSNDSIRGWHKVWHTGNFAQHTHHIGGEAHFAPSSYADPWNGQSCAIKANGHIALAGTILQNTSAGERQHKCSHNWGYFMNSAGLGWYDWANGRNVFAYEVGNNRVVTYRYLRAAGGFQSSYSLSGLSMRLSDEDINSPMIISSKERSKYSIDNYMLLSTDEGTAVVSQNDIVNSLAKTINNIEFPEDYEHTDMSHEEFNDGKFEVTLKFDDLIATLVTEIKNLKEEVAELKQKIE